MNVLRVARLRWHSRCWITLVLLLAAGCGEDVAPDSVPPQTIADLAVSAADDSSAVLTWTAPGDDGTRGAATTYDLRTTTGAVPAAWDTVAAAPGEPPAPAEGGTEQTHSIHGLEVDTVYRFALRASDENENWSEFSNVATVVTGDPEPPARITDLRAARLEPRAVTLAWTAPADDGDLGYAAEYALRRSSTLITEETWDLAETIPVWFSPRTAGRAESLRVAGLEVEAIYHFAIRARDFGGRWSALSNDLEVVLPEDTVPPGAITTLEVTHVGVFTVTLRWTAPGNDGNEGRATAYRVRHAPGPIDTEGAWTEAAAVEVEKAPGIPGAIETLELTNLPGGAERWFSVRTVDEMGNVGGLSNPVSEFVPRAPRVWTVLADGSGDVATIQAGIDSAAAGDTVLVYPGTYVENLEFRGRDIVLRSADGWESTTIDGSAAPLPVIVVARREGSACTIRGFTITHGSAPRLGVIGGGGGVHCEDSRPTLLENRFMECNADYGGALNITHRYTLASPDTMYVRDNLFMDNIADGNGGAVEVYGVVAVFERNVFIRNRTLRGDGGGIDVRLTGGGLRIVDNVFMDNQAYDKGGGIHLVTGPNNRVVVSRNLVVRNTALGLDFGDSGSGGGVYIATCRGEVTQNTIVFNQGFGETPCGGGGIAILASPVQLPLSVRGNIVAYNGDCGIACRNSYPGTIGPNLLWHNGLADAGTLYGQCDPEVVDAMVIADPLFCDQANDDFRVATGSPAISGETRYGAFREPGCAEPAQAPMGPWRGITSRHE